MRDDTTTRETIRRATRQAYVDWIASQPWHHFATLTPQSDLPCDKLVREFKYGFIRRASFHCPRIAWFAVVETGASGHRHVHALTSGTDSLTVDGLASAWKAGYAKILLYDKRGDAAAYVTKDILDRAEWYDVSTRWFRRQTMSA